LQQGHGKNVCRVIFDCTLLRLRSGQRQSGMDGLHVVHAMQDVKLIAAVASRPFLTKILENFDPRRHQCFPSNGFDAQIRFPPA